MRSLSQRQWQALGGVASRTRGPSFAPPHRAQLRRQSEEGRGLRRLDCPSFPGASSQERHGRPIGDPPVLTPLLAAPLSTVSGAGHRRGEWSTRLSISGRAGQPLYAALLLAARGAAPQTQPRTGSGTLLSPAPPPLAQSPVRPPAPHYHPGRSSRSRGRSLLSTLLRAEVV
jgi:hypothetical protein